MIQQNAAIEYVNFVQQLCPSWVESFARDHDDLDGCSGEEYASSSSSTLSFGMGMPVSTLAGPIRYKYNFFCNPSLIVKHE